MGTRCHGAGKPEQLVLLPQACTSLLRAGPSPRRFLGPTAARRDNWVEWLDGLPRGSFPLRLRPLLFPVGNRVLGEVSSLQ